MPKESVTSKTTPTKKTETTRRTPPAPKDNSLKKMLIVCGAGLIALALVWGIVFTLKDPATPSTPTTQPTATPTAPVTKAQRSVTGKTLEQDKKDAIAALTNILVVADKSPTGVATSARLQTLDKDDYSVIDPTLPTFIHYGPDSTQGMKTSTYQSLVTLSSVVKERNAAKKIAPVSDDAWKQAYGDPELGTVFVPLSVYVGSSTAFSLEMVYVDGKWQLAPYSLLDAVRLSAAMQNGTTGN